MVLSRCGSDLLCVFDTFMDVDRGYYPRNAFIDRRFNPRPAAGVFTALASLFPGREPFALVDGGSDNGSDEALDFEHAGVRYRLVCAPQEATLAALGALAPGATAHDLLAGREAQVSDLRAEMTRRPPGGRRRPSHRAGAARLMPAPISTAGPARTTLVGRGGGGIEVLAPLPEIEADADSLVAADTFLVRRRAVARRVPRRRPGSGSGPSPDRHSPCSGAWSGRAIRERR